MRTALKGVGGVSALFIFGYIISYPFVIEPSRRAGAVRERLKTGMTAAEVVEILEHPDQERPRILKGRHYFVLQALNAAGKAACAAGEPPRGGDCQEYISDRRVLGQFPQALAARIKATGRAEVWKAEIHADFHIYMETEYVFVVSFGQDGKAASIGEGGLVTY